MRKIPAAALHFDASTTEFAAAADGLRKFSGVAYAGGVITGHFYWGRVAFDLATTRFAERVPILIEHDRSQRAGFGQLSADAATGDLRITGTLLGNAHGQAIATEADAGFPWQLSVHIEPGSIEEIGEGFTTTINGHAVTGPLTVFRNSLIRETSFTPTGADSLTHARVFASGDEVSVPVIQHEVQTMSEESTQRIAALESELAKVKEDFAASIQRAETAEAALAGIQASARVEQIKTLFAAMGREYSDDAAKPYLQIDDTAFAVVLDDLSRVAKSAPAHLFSEKATQGTAPAAAALDPTTIYAARVPGRKESCRWYPWPRATPPARW